MMSRVRNKSDIYMKSFIINCFLFIRLAVRRAMINFSEMTIINFIFRNLLRCQFIQESQLYHHLIILNRY